mmetsp:Transcript_3587/g.8247  ORF Transcript_3587/g.8247 Transcript_3587/m.8247 type:complete len:221 (+) Transcript_3587:394-1056(+)
MAEGCPAVCASTFGRHVSVSRPRCPPLRCPLLPPSRPRCNLCVAFPRPDILPRVPRLRVDGSLRGCGHRRVGPRRRVCGDVQVRQLWNACCRAARWLCRRPRDPEVNGSDDSREGGPVGWYCYRYARWQRRQRATRPHQTLRHCGGACVWLCIKDAHQGRVTALQGPCQALVLLFPRAHEVCNIFCTHDSREPPSPLQQPPKGDHLAPQCRWLAAEAGGS